MDLHWNRGSRTLQRQLTSNTPSERTAASTTFTAFSSAKEFTNSQNLGTKTTA